MLQCSFSFAAAQLLVQMTSALQKSQCCSAVSAAQHSENCSATSIFACGMLQGRGLEGWGLGPSAVVQPYFASVQEPFGALGPKDLLHPLLTTLGDFPFWAICQVRVFPRQTGKSKRTWIGCPQGLLNRALLCPRFRKKKNSKIQKIKKGDSQLMENDFSMPGHSGT